MRKCGEISAFRVSLQKHQASRARGEQAQSTAQQQARAGPPLLPGQRAGVKC